MSAPHLGNSDKRHWRTDSPHTFPFNESARDHKGSGAVPGIQIIYAG